MTKQTIYRDILPAHVTYWIIEDGRKLYVKGDWVREEVDDGNAVILDEKEERS